ncbi:hypothetical protein [Microbacterium sp. H1-D42]|uniref:hypothetical protein n=1 Tax=Microbacterium sp. H1-D42 TaxID=2925844 RepID=UPI001F53847E|nr:hypothetical protein [Microbacterium sp. H1-D42]UNK69529.1 hypothetical protein MNR00_10085 [Microbacterium sp. H1-D42]
MTSRIGVGIMGAALLLYIVTAVWLAVMFFSVGTAAGIGMGIALIVIAPIGAWALIRELVFGFGADRLGRTLDAEGGMPEAPEQLSPSGRLRREDVEPMIAQYTTAAESAQDDWRARYRLGVVQDAAGRRKDARASIREAIRLARVRP